MIPSDQSKFYKFMRDIFLEEWPFVQPLTSDQLSRWFRALELIDLDRIKIAFGKYLCDSHQSKSPPKSAAILEIIKDIPFDTSKLKCYVDNCFDKDVEMCCYNNKIMVCRFHADEMILKLDAQSPRAQVIRILREYEKERNDLGMSGRDYIKMKNPRLFDTFEKMRVADRKEGARKNIVNALHNFYDTPLSPEERKKILADMRSIAIERQKG